MTVVTDVAERHRHRRYSRAVAVAILLVVVNLGFPIAASHTAKDVALPAPGTSAEITRAIRLPDGQVVAATNNNQVLLLREGRAVSRVAFPYLIGALSAAPDGKQIYVGTSDGKVTVLDDALHRLTDLRESGRIVGLSAAGDQGIYVAHGVGPFSDRYWVAFFPAHQAKPIYEHRVEFTISSLASSKDVVVYSTANGRVGALRPADGVPLWTVTVSRPVGDLTVTPVGILTGDDRGGLSLLDPQTGKVQWLVNVTASPIRSVAADPISGLLLASDNAGAIFALDRAGTVVYRGQITSSFVQAFLPGPDGITTVPQDGAWLTLQPAAIQSAGTAANLRLAWLGADLVLLLVVVLALFTTIERWRRTAARFWMALRRSRTGLLFVAPALLLIFLFDYYPAGMALYFSLTNYSLADVTKFIGLENYRLILTTDYYFRVGIGNILLILLFGILKTVSVPLLAAELIFWIPSERIRYVFRTLAIFPAVVPSLVTVLLWRLIYDPYEGPLNQFLVAIGMPQLQHAWLGEEKTAIWAIIGTGFPYLGAFAFLILLGGLLNINVELFDAANIDGAGWLSRFRQIDLPLLVPQFRLLLFFAFVDALQGFAGIYVLTRGGPGDATYVPALEMYMRISNGEFGYANAIGVLLFVAILLGTVGILRFRRDVAVDPA